MTRDEFFMNRAIELARGPAFTSPNPRVGCVVVRDDVIVAEGAHLGAGHLHAEAVALDGIDARDATLYVNLEPCAHEGRTPPCAPLVVASGVARVVIAIEDPDPRVSGSGLRLLQEAGIEVVTGVLAAEAARLNRAYLHHRLTKRSFVSLKLALSLDGQMSAPDGSSRWITSSETRRLVHMRRLEADAVLVGAGTVVADDPALTVRHVDALRQPLRVVVDARGVVSPEARIFSEPGEVLMAATTEVPHEVQTAWKGAGAEVVLFPAGPGGVDLAALFHHLGTQGVVETFCEGGPTLATSLLTQDLVDRLELHYGPLVLGPGGPALGDVGVRAIAEAQRWTLSDVGRSGNDALVTLERGV